MNKVVVRNMIRVHALSAVLPWALSCASSRPAASSNVSSAWQKKNDAHTGEVIQPREGARFDRLLPEHAAPAGDPIASVDGRPIARGRVIDLLLRGHGPAILEQLVVLDLAQRRAAEGGLTITDSDIAEEGDHALRRLIDPLGMAASVDFDREEAERILAAVLARRNISPEEYRISLARNATLRKIVESEHDITDSELHNEYVRRYGERVEVRHIQVATTVELSRAMDRLAAGESFEDVAKKHSANRISGANGGLMAPISPADEEIPAVVRETISKLRPGEVSNALRVGEWYQILMLVRKIPAEAMPLETVRTELERRIRLRIAEPAMQSLHEELFRSSRIDIHDATLREAVERLRGDDSG